MCYLVIELNNKKNLKGFQNTELLIAVISLELVMKWYFQAFF